MTTSRVAFCGTCELEASSKYASSIFLLDLEVEPDVEAAVELIDKPLVDPYGESINVSSLSD